MEEMPLLLQEATRQVHTEFHKELQNPFREEANWKVVCKQWPPQWVSHGYCGSCGRTGIWVSQAFLMFSIVQFFLGLPTRLLSGTFGKAREEAKVTWCWGWALGLRRMCPRSLRRVKSMIFRRGPSWGEPTASFAFWNTNSLVLFLLINFVCTCKILRRPFSWNVFRSRPTDSVDSNDSKPYSTRLVMTALNTSSFHFV